MSGNVPRRAALERLAAVKRLLFALTLAALLQCAAHAQAQQPDAKKTPAQPPTTKREELKAIPKREPLKAIPDEVSNHELRDLDGQSLYLSNYRGRPFVLNVWATWCGPCVRQIPDLNKLYEEYSKQGVEFVGLATEDPKADAEHVRASARELKIKYKLGWIDAETAKALLTDRPSIPHTFVVAADGRIVTHLIGFNPNEGQRMLRDGIEKALNPAPAQ
jgi:thiol-disulfide isomerase/thioredoxin